MIISIKVEVEINEKDKTYSNHYHCIFNGWNYVWSESEFRFCSGKAKQKSYIKRTKKQQKYNFKGIGNYLLGLLY